MIREKPLPSGVLQRISGMVRAIRSCDDVVALFFFGSLARGELKPLSDLDLAVLLKTNSDRGKILDRQLELMGIISKELGTDEFDLIILNTAPIRFSYEILRTGRRVFLKDPYEVADFQERVVKGFLDFRYYRAEFDREFLKGLGF